MILQQVPETRILPALQDTIRKPLLVGGGLHVLNSRVETAVRLKDRPVLIDLAKKEIAAGAEALAINLGPGRTMAGLTPWVVRSIAEAVDVPLFVSSGITAMEGLLEEYGSRITINAVTADPATLTGHCKTAGRYGTGIVVLLVKPGVVPTGTHGRLQLASDVVFTALETGLPFHRLYLDPVITCRPDPIAREISRGLPDIGPVLEALASIRESGLGINTIAALNNWSFGLFQQNRTAVRSRMLYLLAGVGLDAVIMNCFDNPLMRETERMGVPDK